MEVVDDHAMFEEEAITTHTMGSWRTFVLKTLSGMDDKRVDTRSTENVFSRAQSYVSFPIDVSRIIVQQVHDCLGKKASALVFPNLIIALCRKKKVEENAFDEILPGLSGITRARLPLLLGLENPKSKDPVHEQSADEILPAFNAEASPEPEHDAPDPPPADPTPDTHCPRLLNIRPLSLSKKYPTPSQHPILLMHNVVVTAPRPRLDALRTITPLLPSPAQHLSESAPDEELLAPPKHHHHVNIEKKTKRYFCIRTAGTGQLSLHVKDCCNRLPELPMDHCHLEDKVHAQHVILGAPKGASELGGSWWPRGDLRWRVEGFFHFHFFCYCWNEYFHDFVFGYFEPHHELSYLVVVG
ncbi:hypothetical protein F3Y22_tig00111993pilonHSYRG00043 [Hibiscus syriacus]|uniref:Uncharacterized protein n=1 Tax=Hibiscus syriacus TaxID=106335 RepID=A0A6A2YA49_HIBSY|nr:hypothetical protein F3Y22_tig00111993pilonHSYRG00043 [Hibiscus syriacus]